MIGAPTDPNNPHELSENQQSAPIKKSRAEREAPIDLIAAIKQGNFAFVKRAFSRSGRIKADGRDEFGSTLLMIAAEYAQEEICKFLIFKGADVNAKDDDGLTPMNWAATGGDVKIAQMLFEKKAKIDEQNNSGETPLLAAANEGHLEFVKFLVNNGAKIDHQENSGYTALMLAAYENHLEVVQYLLEQGADTKLKQTEGLSIADLLELSNRQMQLLVKKYI